MDRLFASWQLRKIGDTRNWSWRLDPNQIYGFEGDDEDDPDNPSAPRDPAIRTTINEEMAPWAGVVKQAFLGKTQPVPPWDKPENQEHKTSKHRSVVDPPLYDRYVFNSLAFSWQAMFLKRILPDGDIIEAVIEPNAVDDSTVEFVLEAAHHITWWKAIRVPDGQGSS